MSGQKRKRDVPVLFWVSAAEMDAIQQKMEQFGTKNLSAYLRKMAVDGYVVQLDLPVLKELLTHLGFVQVSKEGWEAQRREAAAAVAEGDLPGALPLAWSLLHVPVVLGTLALGLSLYPAMPDMLPLHADFAGNVDSWAPKTLATAVGFPIAFELFMAACFAFCHGMILRSKRPTDPAAPATSALAYGLFARAQSVFLLVTGILVSGGIGILFLLSSTGFLALGQAVAVIIVLCFLVTVGSVAMSLVYGQAGSRVFKRMQEDDVLLADEDDRWKLGVFYFNPDDASVFLPERFGIGWTMNFARPAAWAIVLGGLALTASFIIAVELLFQGSQS